MPDESALPDALTYYARHGPVSDPGPHAELVRSLPSDVEALRAIVQGLVLHVHWAGAYGVTLSEERQQDAIARSVAAILSRVLELDARPLHEARPPESRFAGTCRDFTLLMCSMLRNRGVPARARCGFGAYFRPGRFEDHWVCEYWDGPGQRWVQVDAQIDALQREALKLTFDPLDVPAGEFLSGGRAWEACRSEGADPEHFGIFDMRGLWFIRGNVLRDLAALNRVELLPWDGWGLLLQRRQDEFPPGDFPLLDRIATLTQRGDAFEEYRSLYESEPPLRVPEKVMNFQRGVMEPVSPGREAPWR